MKKFIVLILLIFGTINLYADNNNSSNPSPNFIKLIRKPQGNRPHAPSQNGIECSIQDNTITIFLPEEVGFAEITIGNEYAIIWSTVVTADNPTTQLPVLANGITYIITCTLPDGSQYIGLLE